MNVQTKARIALLLGIVILAVDLLLLYNSAAGFGQFPGRGMPYYNASVASNSVGGFPARGNGFFGPSSVVFDLIILIADAIMLYLVFSISKHVTKSPAKTKK